MQKFLQIFSKILSTKKLWKNFTAKKFPERLKKILSFFKEIL